MQVFTLQECLSKHQGHNAQIIENPGLLFIYEIFFATWISGSWGKTVVWFGLVWFGLVWFGLFVHSFSHIRNTGHINYRLQFTTSSSSIGTTAHCGLWPVEQYPSIFPYLSPTLSIFSLPALEDLSLLPLSILSRVFPFVSIIDKRSGLIISCNFNQDVTSNCLVTRE